MKIKILKTGEIVDALIFSTQDDAMYFDDEKKTIRVYKGEYEIIPDQPQAKFKLGDKVIYEARAFSSESIFVITRIVIDNDCIMYGSESSSGFLEDDLTLYTEPEKPKTYKYVRWGEAGGEVLYKKVEE